MSLFKNDKKPCPVCQSPTPKIFPTKIEDKPICKECDKKISMDDKLKDKLTLDGLYEHLAYRENNAKLHTTFSESRKVSSGFFGSTISIDDTNRLWYIASGENSPIYHFEDLVSYALLENGSTIESASATGRQLFHGVLENRSMYDIADSMQRFNNTLHHVNGHNKNGAAGNHPEEPSIPAPVRSLSLEIVVNNIYWKSLEITFSPPSVFDNDLRRFYVDYQNKLSEVAEFTQVLFSFFPNQSFANQSFPNQAFANQAYPANEAAANQTAPGVQAAVISVADELRKFKDLLDMNAITQAEFDQKKKELLNM